MQRARDELASGATHGVGIVLSLLGLPFLLAIAPAGDHVRLASGLIFGTTLLTLYGASTAMHLGWRSRAQRFLVWLDHAGIYLLIAGTYTPIALIALREHGGLWLFALVWTLALLGIVAEAAWLDRPGWLKVALYLVMGWIGVFKASTLVGLLPTAATSLILAGGLAYSAGTFFYLRSHRPFMHAIWHLFVLGGSICHFLAISLYLLPGTAGAVP